MLWCRSKIIYPINMDSIGIAIPYDSARQQVTTLGFGGSVAAGGVPLDDYQRRSVSQAT